VPQPLLRTFGQDAWLRGAAAWLFRPGVVLVAWALAFGIWHIPAAYDAAARHRPVHDVEHASFVVAGFLVWALLVDPTRHGRVSRGRRLAMVVALFLMGTIIADVLIFSLHPLYPAYADQAHRVFGISPLRDQQLAGLVMNLDQILTLGTCAVLLLWPELRRRGRATPLLGAGQPA
jgi:cytochrome c oxidase assembly factor CtaG